MIEKFQELLDIIKEYTNDFSTWGIITSLLDIIFFIALIVLIAKIFKLRLRRRKIIIIISIVILLFLISFVFSFPVTLAALKMLGFWSIGILIILYSQEIKHILEIGFHNTTTNNAFTTEEEKQAVINSIANATIYLSERKIGALMSIERTDNLDSLIDKAIVIRGKLSEELLTSLFFVGTATHDGAIIIRKNMIMCAGAYLPSTDKYDVPKSLGTRHRAAIGVSERYDAVTVIVSEETGRISITIDGIIQQDLTKERLTELLTQYILIK